MKMALGLGGGRGEVGGKEGKKEKKVEEEGTSGHLRGVQ